METARSKTNDSFVVYKHTNKVNGKSYIGITCDAHVRWAASGGRYKTYNSVFGRAIDKYGWDSFTHEILESGLSFENACEREKYYIALYHTNICRYGPDCGYNMTDGGGGLGGYEMSAETRTAISQALSNPNVDTLKKMSAASMGRTGFQGCGLSDSHYAALMAGRDRRNKTAGKPVYCITNSTPYSSSAAAGRALNISSSMVSSVCRGERETACGYRFRYATADEALLFPSDERRKVECIDSGEIFETPRDAAQSCGAQTTYILSCCRGEQASTRGLRWRFIS